ncbi:type III-B CRISPR module RAMP protein Cmr1 [Thermodesulfatator atlanticus]|uniref:type III-B CRISPR module RAMP protein Cmr1 n=1 Tax=Thermodesulfatator atlanticus TaxID=501497 RepID=UPI0003B5FD84|nr:type III-B CRISPR module RAMP protein Cmr1 [Thermodesulfatator atlanticus]
MKKAYADFELTVLSPMFLRGADQQKATFRLASLKGTLRYWFRALALGVYGLEDVRRIETEIFGATDQKSHVVFRVLEEKTQLLANFWDTAAKEPEISYLLGPGIRRGTLPLAPCSKVKFRMMAWGKRPETYLKIASGVLWVACFFGGLGARSRRGFGSYAIKFLQGEKPLIAFELPRGKERAFLNAAPLAIQKFLKQSFSGSDHPSEEAIFYPFFAPGKWKVALEAVQEGKEREKAWEKALSRAGKRLRLFRLHPNSIKAGRIFGKGSHSKDYETILQALRSKSAGKTKEISGLKNIALGLPLIFDKEMQIKLKDRGRLGAVRRGSPLFMTLNQFAERLFLSFSAFNESFYPLKDDQSLVLVRRDEEFFIIPPQDTAYALEFVAPKKEKKEGSKNERQ